jgi:23S rRNA pseudouridine1911/1915/1917 synthase
MLRRLDMNTSGVLLAAKDRATASAAHAQFRAKSVSKAYLSLALGVPSSSSFSEDGPIGQHPSVKVARRVAQGGQPALTHMEVRES